MTLHGELRTVLAQLEMVSQVAAVNLEASGGDAGEDIGGRRPPGGILHEDDRQLDYPQKSVEHFRRRIAKAHSDWALGAILKDAQAALEAAKRQPPPKDAGHPMPGDYNWKRWVAETDLSAVEIARKCNVSKRYVNRVRAEYRMRDAA